MPETTSGGNADRAPVRLSLPPDRQPVACALLVHRASQLASDAAEAIALPLEERGFATLPIDLDALHGDPPEPGTRVWLSRSSRAVVEAAEAVAGEIDVPVVLIGHDLGGPAALLAAGRIPAVRAIATLGAPSAATNADREDLRQPAHGHLDHEPDEVPDLETAIRSLEMPLLLLHAPGDRTVSIDHAARLFTHARHPKSFVSLDQADHAMSNAADASFAGTVIAAWAARYVEATQAKYEQLPLSDNRIIARTGPTGFRTELMANGHALIADEPVAVGGTNAGPSPYNLLAAALASCTSMTLRMYADRKGWPLREVTTLVTHSKVHAKDCAECEDREGRIDHLHRILDLQGPLDEAQRQRLREIADRCPVHRTLEGDVLVETELSDVASQSPRDP